MALHKVSYRKETLWSGKLTFINSDPGFLVLKMTTDTDTDNNTNIKLRVRLIRKKEANFMKVHTSTTSLNITHQFIIFSRNPLITIRELKEEILSFFSKSYPTWPSLTSAGVRLQDDSYCDLDDLFLVEDVFDNGSFVNVIYYFPTKPSSVSRLPPSVPSNPVTKSTEITTLCSAPIPLRKQEIIFDEKKATAVTADATTSATATAIPIIPVVAGNDFVDFYINDVSSSLEDDEEEDTKDTAAITTTANVTTTTTDDDDEDDEEAWSDITPSSTPLPTPLTSLNEELKSISPIPPSPTGTPIKAPGHKKLRIRKINKRKNRSAKQQHNFTKGLSVLMEKKQQQQQ